MLIIISLILIFLAFGMAYCPDFFYLKEAVVGSMAGSLLGVGGLILALGLERFLIRREEEQDKQSDIKKILEVIASELVNVACGMIGFKETLVAAIRTVEAGGHLPEVCDLTDHMPRPMNFTDTLGTKILLLNEKQIEVLSVLKGNLQLTAFEIQQVSQGRKPFGLLVAKKMLVSLHHDMRLLADAFEKLKPERKLQLPEKEPEFASIVLKNLAQEE